MLQATKRLLPLYLFILSTIWLHALVQPGAVTTVGGKTGTTAVYFTSRIYYRVGGKLVNGLSPFIPFFVFLYKHANKT